MVCSGTTPLKITVQNSGRAIRGFIDIQQRTYGIGGSHIYAYPIELPAGSVKQFIAYPHLTNYGGDVNIDFDGPLQADTDSISIDNDSNSNAASVGLISDEDGSLESLQNTNPSSSWTNNVTDFNPSYCVPENAPDRSTGYASFNVLMIGPGSERLTPTQWSAIQEWVTSGGSLLLIGGASNLDYLQAADQAQICPLTNLHQAQLPSLDFPWQSQRSVGSNVSAVEGQLMPGAFVQLSQNGHPLITTRHYGAGLVTLVAFDPTSASVSGATQAPKLLKSVIADSLSRIDWSRRLFAGAIDDLSRAETESDATEGVIIASQTPSNPSSTPFGIPDSHKNDPFKTKMPPLQTVGTLFLAYYILVIPVTYFVLKRMKRLEMAWFTTPFISVLFALLFCIFSANLYVASLSRRTYGLLTVADGNAIAHFVGCSEVFIPHGGSYNIVIPNAESLENIRPDESDYSGDSLAQKLQTVDTPNGVEASGMNVGNLAFRRFYYDQPIQLSGSITASLYDSPPIIGLRGTITNGSSLLLNDVRLTIGNGEKTLLIGTMAPGQKINVAGLTQVDTPTILNPAENVPRDPFSSHYAYLTATAPSTPFGLQVGQNLSGPNTVSMIATLPVQPEGAAK